MVSLIRKVKYYFGKFETFYMVALFAAAFIIIMMQAVSRYVFNHPFVWTDELSVNLQMVMAFLGIGYGIRTKSHIKVDGLYKKFPRKVQMVISILFNILFIVIAVICVRYGMQYAMRNWNINFGTMKLGKGKLLIAVPIGFAIAAVYTVLDIVDEIAQLFGKEALFDTEKKEVQA